MSEEATLPEEPDYSVLFDGRLVAYVWRTEGGTFRRAGKQERVVCELPFAEIHSFQPSKHELLQALVQKSKSLDAFLYKLGMEGFRVLEGISRPDATVRKF